VWQTSTNLFKAQYYIARYLVQGVKQRLIEKNTPHDLRQKSLENTARNSLAVLAALNVKIESRLHSPDLFQRSYFMVCNHMSYLDILILSTVQPAVFVTSVEMEKTFFLGDVAKLGGSFFVDRVNRRKMKQEVAELKDLIGQGFNVFLFPEGTSTNGLEILPFKKSLFRVPMETGQPILPICLRYKSIDGEPFSLQNCDRVCWHGDMTFAPHFLQLMKLKSLEVEVDYLEPLDSSHYSSHGELAQAAEQVIRNKYFS
jgi:lyso-ornithine lipid O-acyltransferase